MSCSGILGKGHDKVSFTDVFNRLGGAIRHQDGRARSKAARLVSRIDLSRTAPNGTAFARRLAWRHSGRNIVRTSIRTRSQRKSVGEAVGIL